MMKCGMHKTYLRPLMQCVSNTDLREKRKEPND
jgi:hypothetical protein